MSKLIQMPCKDGTIIVEVETIESEIVPVKKKTGERIIEKVEQAFDKVEDVLMNNCIVLTNALKNLAEKEPNLESATMELGFQLTGEGNIYMVKTAAQGSIKILLNLKLK